MAEFRGAPHFRSRALKLKGSTAPGIFPEPAGDVLDLPHAAGVGRNQPALREQTDMTCGRKLAHSDTCDHVAIGVGAAV